MTDLRSVLRGDDEHLGGRDDHRRDQGAGSDLADDRQRGRSAGGREVPPTEARIAVGGAMAEADATAAEPPPNFAANAAKPPPVTTTGRRMSARRPGVSSSESSPTTDVQCAQPFT